MELTPSQHNMLQLLQEHGDDGMTPTQTQAMTAIGLAKRGLATRTWVGGQGWRCHITDQGRKVLAEQEDR